MNQQEARERLKSLYYALFWTIIGMGVIATAGTPTHVEPHYEFGPKMARQIRGER